MVARSYVVVFDRSYGGYMSGVLSDLSSEFG